MYIFTYERMRLIGDGAYGVVVTSFAKKHVIELCK